MFRRLWHDSFIIVCGTSHSYECHVALMYVTSFFHTHDINHSCMWDDSSTHMTWRVDVSDMTHSCMWHESFIIVCGTTHSHTCHVLLMYVTWFICIHDMMHWCMWDDAFMHMTWRVDVCAITHSCYRTSRIDVCDMTHSYTCHDAFISCEMTHS